MNLSTKVAYNTIVQLISKVVATALGLIAIAIMTRSLGQAGFGQYTTIITFLSFFAIIADFGLTLVTVQMISRPGIEENKVINNLISLRLVSAVLFLGIAPLIVIFFPYEPIIKLGVAVTALSFLFILLNQIFVGLFQRKLRMDKVAIAEVLGRLVLVAGVCLAIKLNYGLLGIMVATVIGSAINFLFHFIFSLSYVRIKLEFDLKVWRQIVILAWPIALTIAFNLIYLRADILILSLIKTQAEVGIYGAAYKVIDVLVSIPYMFAGVVLPILTLSWAKKNIEYFNGVMQKSFDLMVILAIPMILGTQILAKPIMVLVAGDDFAISGVPLRILILAAGALFFGAMFSHAIIALGKQKKIINAYIFTSLTALAGYLIFIPHFSYVGAAWVTIYSELCIFLAGLYYVYKFSRFKPNFKVFLKALFASLIMIGVIYLLPETFYNTGLGLINTLAIAALVYFFCLYLIKGITKKDILDLFNK
ncbi:MAG: flippase [Patescibacteria group bacterium]